MKTNLIKSLFTLFVLTSTHLFAQQEIPDTEAFSQIRNAELKNSHIPEIAYYLTDVSGPRLTGSPGFKRAADWALSTMKKWGLTNTMLEPWGEFGKNWELKDFSIIMKAPYAQPVLAFPDPWSANTKGVEQAQVMLLTSDQLLDTVYISKHLGEFKGKIILAIDNVSAASKNVDQNFKPSATRLTDTELSQLQDTYMASSSDVQQIISYLHDLNSAQLLLKKAGIIALIRSERDDKNGVVFNTTYTGFKPHSPEIMPKATMAFEDGQKIKRLIESGHPVEIAIQISANISLEDNKGYNVIAEIPGTDPTLKSQVVMLGAHLDSWAAATGATDNVAGCAVMMEAVRLLDSLGLKPKRTIRIALWGGEEEGVYGSYNYVKKHFMNAENFEIKPEQARISAYYNLDNGTGKIRGIFVQGNSGVKPIFEQWLKPFHDLGATTVTLKNTGSTDHLSFDWAGIPGFEFIQDPIDYETRTHHSNMDNYEHLQIDDLKQAAIIVASFVYQSSIRPALLPRKPLVKEPYVWDGL